MVAGLIGIIILLGLIWWRLGLISDKLNADYSEHEERERQTRTLKELLKSSEEISRQMDTIVENLGDINANTDTDYQKKRDADRLKT